MFASVRPSELISLQKNPKLIRNICVLAHVRNKREQRKKERKEKILFVSVIETRNKKKNDLKNDQKRKKKKS